MNAVKNLYQAILAWDLKVWHMMQTWENTTIAMIVLMMILGAISIIMEETEYPDNARNKN